MRVSSLPILLLAAAVAGCLAPAAPAPAGPAAHLADRLAAGLPPLQWSVAEAVDWWEGIATDYPKHDANTPANAQLRAHLVAELEVAGLQVEARHYPGRVEGVDLPGGLPGDATDYWAIVATKPGASLPDRRIGLVSHYDTETLTVHGAYDDASGVAAGFSLCKALAKVPMERTLACLFFDGEERGLVASERYVEDVVKEGDEGYAYDFVLGYDMVGLNWPGYDPWKLYVMCGENHADALFGFTTHLMGATLGLPAAGVEVLDVHDRNSDEMSFKRAGIPILRFAGGRHAADYDQYHKPLDTVEHVYELAGGRANFEKGFAAVVEASYTTVLALDRTSLDELLRES